jgi:hypothetical protein
MTVQDWKIELMKSHAAAVSFIESDGRDGYGRAGDWVAMVGDCRATDCVGVYTAGGNVSMAEGRLRVQLRCV